MANGYLMMLMIKVATCGWLDSEMVTSTINEIDKDGEYLSITRNFVFHQSYKFSSCSFCKK